MTPPRSPTMQDVYPHYQSGIKEAKVTSCGLNSGRLKSCQSAKLVLAVAHAQQYAHGPSSPATSQPVPGHRSCPMAPTRLAVTG